MPVSEFGAMPLPLSTTWAVLASVGASLAEVDGALVVSIDLPGHRWCHALSVLDAVRVNDARHWLERAANEFPGVVYPAIGLLAEPDRELWRQQPCPPLLNAVVEWWPQHWIALTAAEVKPAHALPADYRIVEVATDDQWQQFAGLPSAGGVEYQRTWAALKRRRQDAGRARFFAAVHGDRLVATGGIVLCDIDGRRVARFEDIGARPEHRRQGLAGHLIAAAHDWAQGQGAGTSVLVADAEGEAIGLYHRLGFNDSDLAWMVLPRVAH